MYRVLCSACHTATGDMNSMVHLTEGWSRDMYQLNLRKLHRLKSFMPPFAGNEEDLSTLIDYLQSLHERGD